MEFKFVEATKEKLKARVAFYGLSGSGKTIAALRIGRALADLEGKHLAVIDTEGRAMSKYLGLKFGDESPLKFATINLQGQHSPVNFTKAIEAAEKSGQFSTIVIDSLSHAWEGTLQLADDKSWKAASPAHTALMNKIINSTLHIIVTIRADEETQTDKDAKGKWKKVVIGTKPKSKKDIIYEFDIAGEIVRGTNTLTIEKTRSFSIPVDSEYVQPGAAFARELHAWLDDGAEPASEAPTTAGPTVAKVATMPPPPKDTGYSVAQFVENCTEIADKVAMDARVKLYTANKTHFSETENQEMYRALRAASERLKAAQSKEVA